MKQAYYCRILAEASGCAENCGGIPMQSLCAAQPPPRQTNEMAVLQTGHRHSAITLPQSRKLFIIRSSHITLTVATLCIIAKMDVPTSQDGVPEWARNDPELEYLRGKVLEYLATINGRNVISWLTGNSGDIPALG